MTATLALGAVGAVVLLQVGGYAYLHRRIGGRLTAGTAVTLLRGGGVGVLAAGIAGVPSSGLGAWWPAALVAAVGALDALDGAVARWCGTVSALGERLDYAVDALTLLVGSAVAVAVGMAPLVYVVVVGGSRYGFLLATTLWRASGRRVSRLPPSAIRRVHGGLQVLVLVAVLAPVPGQSPSRVLALFACLAVLAVFARDLLAVTSG